MQDYHVPIALIRRVCFPSGQRLPKLKRIEFPPKAIVNPVTKPYSGYTVSTFDATKGNLEKQQYQFFVGRTRTNDNSATCRWCGVVGYGDHYQREHGKGEGSKIGCKKKLTDLYKTFCVNKQCMMCDNATMKTTWGVPLCSKECETEWQFHAPASLRFEVDMVTRNEREEAGKIHQV